MRLNTKAVTFTLIILAGTTILFFRLSAYSQMTDEDYVDQEFFEDFEGDGVDTDVWHIATWEEHGGQTGTERCYTEDGYLNMVFINDSEEGYLSSAIQTREEYLYGRWEARLKPSDVSGVLNSMYTIDWNNTADGTSENNGTKQEIDIEFLTFSFGEGAGEVHYAVHAEDRESFHTNPDIELDFDPSLDFHVWGFEITPEYIEWFVDDEVLLRYTYSENDITIDAPYQLKFNVWSSDGWVNGPPESDTECLYQIDWIRFTPAGSGVKPEDMRTGNTSESIRFLKTPRVINGSSTIEYSIENASEVIFSVYDASGARLFTEIRGRLRSGIHTHKIDGGNLSPGTYYLSLSADKSQVIRKIIVAGE